MKNTGQPDFTQLIDWLEGHLSVEEVERLMTQMTKADEAVQADIVWLRKFYQANQTIQLPELPAKVGQFLEQHFAVYAQSRRQKLRYKYLLANLDFDSYQDSTRLVYTTKLATIYITIEEHSQNGRFSLTGRVSPLAENSGPFQVLLLQDIQEFDAILTDDSGKFILRMLPPGDYDLICSSPQYEIIISDLQLS